MNKNVCGIDSWLRLTGSLMFAILFFSSAVSGALGLITISVAILLMVTGLTGYCPVNAFMGGNSCAIPDNFEIDTKRDPEEVA